MRYVVIPQAVRRILAPLLNDFIGLQKDTALVQVVGVIDAFNQSRIISSNAFNLSAGHHCRNPFRADHDFPRHGLSTS